MGFIVEADGGARGNPGLAGSGAVVRDGRTKAILRERGKYLGHATNNVAEYQGLILGLEAAHGLDPQAHIEVRMDSKLVVQQMMGAWSIKNAALAELAAQARAIHPARKVTYTWVPREQNKAADRLANEAMDACHDICRDMEPRQGELALELPPPTPNRPVLAAAPSGAAPQLGTGNALTLVLIRHGATATSSKDVLSGSAVPGPSLTAKGRTEAALAADVSYRIGREMWRDLPTVTGLVTSPMIAAQETAAAIGRRLGLPVQGDCAWQEVHLGQWEGLSRTEVNKRWPGQLRQWHTGSVAPDGGESLADVGARVQQAVADLLAADAQRTLVAVSHKSVIRSVLGSVLGMPTSKWVQLRVPLASVSIVRQWANGYGELVVAGWPVDV